MPPILEKPANMPEPKSGHHPGSITRRSLLASLLALPLASCQDGEAVSVRFRVIAKVWVDATPYQASTVMQVNYTRIKGSLTGMGGATRLYGEALIFDLPQGRGTFFVLPCWRNTDGSLSEIYEPGILTTIGVESSVGSLKDADLARIQHATGRLPFKYHAHMPAIVAFRDESQPKTIFEVNPSDMGASFYGVQFVGLEIEITTDPVTQVLTQRLPWIKTWNGPEVFPRDPPGRLRPDSEAPIGYIITKSKFFGTGSR